MRLLLKIVVFYGAVWELGPFSPNTRDLCRPEPPRIGSPLEGGDLGEGDRDHRGDVATASPPKAGTATRLGPQARLREGRGGAGRGAARPAARVPDATPAPPPPARPQSYDGEPEGAGPDASCSVRGAAPPHVPRRLPIRRREGRARLGFLMAPLPRAAAFPRRGGAWPGRCAYKGGRRRRRHFANGEQRRGRGEAQRRFSWFRTPAAGW